MTELPNLTEDDFFRSPCPLACALDIVGDRWSLVILRDLMFFQKSVFNDFLTSPEKISTNILTDRLKRLEGLGLIQRNQYQAKPPRYKYELTEFGQTLRPVMAELVRWGQTHLSKQSPLSEAQLRGTTTST
ncbi:winged helix-turn-helix transcriptional regulator [Teredinibacter turnerae]|uniref:Transcriptional regulator, HxlR family n=1 Tax=Teredinibacter turnerae (strain ATCC 39867 / T7901) TaxID=377629 RepID=C5BKH8_TERTT|nr:helix-turn-helix domain-containing protein [Teredinibacter turnerae]ACR11490.1 transcriptional regulator, HxlR family [Teredinibacter turnerae T7901]